MYSEIILSNSSPVISLRLSIENYEDYDERLVEFLILPRFLISREKINKLIKDEELQRNLIFLIVHQSLRYYNNESNKKLPE